MKIESWLKALTLLTASLTASAAQAAKIINVLVYSFSSQGTWHRAGREVAVPVFTKMGTDKGFQVMHVMDPAQLTTANLARTQVLVFNNCDGSPNDVKGANRTAIEQYVENGGGFLITHGAGAFVDGWPWLRNAIVQPFSGHESNLPTGRMFEDPDGLKNPETRMIFDSLAPEAMIKDEWYAWVKTPRGSPGVTVLFTADEKSYNAGLRMGDHPVVWAKDVVKGRVVYQSMGHTNDFWSQSNGFALPLTWNLMRYVARDAEAPLATERDAPSGPTGIRLGHPGKSLSVSIGGWEDFTLVLFDMRGSLVLAAAGKGSREFSVRHLPAGVYHAKVEAGKAGLSRKITLP